MTDSDTIVVQTIDISVGPDIPFKTIDEDLFSNRIDRSQLKLTDGLSKGFRISAGHRLSKRFEGSEGAESKKVEIDELTGYDLYGVVQPPYNMEYLAKLYEASSPHHGAVDAKVTNTVGLGYDFIQSNVAKRKLEDVQGQSAYDARVKKLVSLRETLVEWLESCNKEDDFLETMKKVMTDYHTTGNGYLEIGRSLNSNQINYIGHIPSSSVRVRRKRDGFVQLVSNRAVFFRNFGAKDPDPIGGDRNPNEIIHFKNYSPTNGFYGVPDIVAALDAVAGDTFASKFNLDYFENKAVPRYIITVKGAKLSEGAERLLHDFFRTGLKGKNHRSLYIPLPPDTQENKVEFKMEPIEAGVQDASFANYKKLNLNEILMVHRVPLTKIGNAEGVSLAVARDADKTFKEQVCRPDAKIVENKISKIIRELTDLMVLKFDELELSDELTQAKIDEIYLRMQTVVPNEVRARLKLPNRKGGDKPVELKPQQQADQRATGNQSRARDTQRKTNAPDTDGEARNPKGEGRSAS